MKKITKVFYVVFLVSTVVLGAFGLVADIIGYGTFETRILSKIGMSFEMFQAICLFLCAFEVVAFLIVRKIVKKKTSPSNLIDNGSKCAKEYRRKTKELFSKKSDSTDDSEPIKEYRGKTEKVFGIISVVCIGLIFVGLLCKKFEFVSNETGFFLIVNGLFWGMIAIPNFFFRRFNRMRIFETKISVLTQILNKKAEFFPFRLFK